MTKVNGMTGTIEAPKADGLSPRQIILARYESASRQAVELAKELARNREMVAQQEREVIAINAAASTLAAVLNTLPEDPAEGID